MRRVVSQKKLTSYCIQNVVYDNFKIMVLACYCVCLILLFVLIVCFSFCFSVCFLNKNKKARLLTFILKILS